MTENASRKVGNVTHINRMQFLSASSLTGRFLMSSMLMVG